MHPYTPQKVLEDPVDPKQETDPPRQEAVHPGLHDFNEIDKMFAKLGNDDFLKRRRDRGHGDDGLEGRGKN
ncbi:unnamed protein product [Ilex paraguariensis]|uniref:Uncharacterized protein n=1 Tax=Ilex paraguariensis TaxID=185542 RepID=A0ABC8TAH1_9AQUA